MKKIQQHFINYKKPYLSLLLFLLIFCILGIPFTKWGFKTDDWGNIWHSVTNSWRDLWQFFTEGKSIEIFNHPSNTDINSIEQAFFCGLYRPMSFVYFAPQYWLFHINPYGYYLVTIAIHALASVVFFNLLAFFTTPILAFCAAAYFGFHPSLLNWLGWTSAQTYQIELLVMLLIFLLIKYFLDHKKWWAYILACVLFLTNVFLREQTIFLPFWLMVAIPLYEQTKSNFSWWYNIRRAFFLNLPFIGISAFYILVRLHYFPLTSNTTSLTFQPTWHSFITRMISRKYDFVTYIADMFGLSAMPNNHQILKGFLILTIFAVLTWLFIRAPNKLVVLFIALSVPLFSWPALLMHTQPRYFYMALPIFIAFIVALIHQKWPTYKTWFLVFMTIVISFNALFLFTHLKKREQTLNHITTIFHELVKNPKIINKPLCFLNLPAPWFHEGTTQAIWLLRQNSSQPVFQFDMVDTNSFSLAPKYHQLNPLCITWDDQMKNFVILDQHDSNA